MFHKILSSVGVNRVSDYLYFFWSSSNTLSIVGMGDNRLKDWLTSALEWLGGEIIDPETFADSISLLEGNRSSIYDDFLHYTVKARDSCDKLSLYSELEQTGILSMLDEDIVLWKAKISQSTSRMLLIWWIAILFSAWSKILMLGCYHI